MQKELGMQQTKDNAPISQFNRHKIENLIHTDSYKNSFEPQGCNVVLPLSLIRYGNHGKNCAATTTYRGRI